LITAEGEKKRKIQETEESRKSIRRPETLVCYEKKVVRHGKWKVYSSKAVVFEAGVVTDCRVSYPHRQATATTTTIGTIGETTIEERNIA
jgi:hypothetical protein